VWTGALLVQNRIANGGMVCGLEFFSSKITASVSDAESRSGLTTHQYMAEWCALPRPLLPHKHIGTRTCVYKHFTHSFVLFFFTTLPSSFFPKVDIRTPWSGSCLLDSPEKGFYGSMCRSLPSCSALRNRCTKTANPNLDEIWRPGLGTITNGESISS
jgi:hypothetical protein